MIVKVNLATVIPWDKYEETYTTALNSGEGPDVGYMYSNEMFPNIHRCRCSRGYVFLRYR